MKTINKFNYQNNDKKFGGEIGAGPFEISLRFYSQPINAKNLDSHSETSFNMDIGEAERLRDDLTKAIELAKE